jgi:hypothetical protein
MRCTTVSIQSPRKIKEEGFEITELLPHSTNVDVYIQQ